MIIWKREENEWFHKKMGPHPFTIHPFPFENLSLFMEGWIVPDMRRTVL